MAVNIRMSFEAKDINGNDANGRFACTNRSGQVAIRFGDNNFTGNRQMVRQMQRFCEAYLAEFPAPKSNQWKIVTTTGEMWECAMWRPEDGSINLYDVNEMFMLSVPQPDVFSIAQNVD